MREGVLLWEAANEEQMLATPRVVCESREGAVLVADNVPMDYLGGLAFLLGDRVGGRRLLERDEHRQPRCARFTADGRRLLIGTAGGTARWSVWNVGDDQPLACIAAPYARLLHARLDEANEAVVRDELEHLDEVFADRGLVVGAIADDGAIVAGSSEPIGDSVILDARWLSRLVHLWAVGSAHPMATLEADEPVDALAFTADSRSLAVATRSGAVEIWDVATARRVARHAPQQASRPWAVHPRPDGGGFVMGLEDGTLVDVPLRGDPTVVTRVSDAASWDLIVRDDGSLVTVSWDHLHIVVVDCSTGVRRELRAPPELADFGTVAPTTSGRGVLIATPTELRRIEW